MASSQFLSSKFQHFFFSFWDWGVPLATLQGREKFVIFLCFAGNYKQEVVTAQLLVGVCLVWGGGLLGREKLAIVYGVRKYHPGQI